VTSHISREFRRAFAELPKDIQTLAREAYRVFEANPAHPSLKFKKLPPFEDIWSARINANYRVLAKRRDDIVLWFFIGSHAHYDKVVSRL
jgi:mRNA-degrading endonuclease RelE of RelBE toxin-antitoxin system